MRYRPRCSSSPCQRPGNYLNGGSSRGGAYGFTLETLTKADSTRGADNKTTLADVLVTITLAAPADQRPMLQLASELAPVGPAKTLSLTQLQQDLGAMQAALKAGQAEVRSRGGRVAVCALTSVLASAAPCDWDDLGRCWADRVPASQSSSTGHVC